jgi:hypothetical protein
VIVGNSYLAGSSSICVLEGDASGTLSPAVGYPVPGSSWVLGLGIGDLNADGRLDVVAGYEVSTPIAAGVLALHGTAGGTLGAPADYSTGGGRPGAIAVTDVNGDARPDLVVVDMFSSTLCVLKGNADGTLDVPSSHSSAGSNPLAVTIGDLSGDGRPDVAIANAESDTVSVLKGNASGGLDPGVAYASGGDFTFDVAVGDVSGDGRPDLVVANHGAATLGVLKGNSSGSLDPVVSYSSGGQVAEAVAIADLTGDGRPDVVVAHRISNTICVLAGNAGGSLDSAVCYGYDGPRANSIAVGDVSGDGRPDVVVATRQGFEKVCVLKGNAAGTLDPFVSYPVPGSPHSVHIADVSGDGRPDVIVAHDQGVGVLRANATGTLDPVVSYAAGGFNPQSIAVADVNGDGRLDVVALEFAGVRVLEGNAAGTLEDSGGRYASGGSQALAIAVGDLSGDGRPDARRDALLLERGLPPPEPARPARGHDLLRGRHSGALSVRERGRRRSRLPELGLDGRSEARRERDGQPRAGLGEPPRHERAPLGADDLPPGRRRDPRDELRGWLALRGRRAEAAVREERHVRCGLGPSAVRSQRLAALGRARRSADRRRRPRLPDLLPRSEHELLPHAGRQQLQLVERARPDLGPLKRPRIRAPTRSADRSRR